MDEYYESPQGVISDHQHAQYVATIHDVHPSELTPYPGNPKLHDMDALAESIEANGQYRSVLARRLADGTLQLLAGHGTTDAVHRAGATVRVEVVEANDEQARRIVLADNAIGARAGFDDHALLGLLDQANTAGGLAGTGYDDQIYRDLLAQTSDASTSWDPDADPDETPDPPADPITEPGDLWQLGDHRLICGDSTHPHSWTQLLEHEAGHIDCVWTDPPYGVSYIGKTADALSIRNDDLDEAGLANLVTAAFDQAVAACRPGAVWYVAAPAGPLNLVFAHDLHRRGMYRQQLIWVKDAFVLGHADYHYRHEPIFYGWKPGAAHQATPDRTQDTVWEIPRPKRSQDHPTMKPVNLITRALRNSTRPRALVADPFGGSGTTLIAAEATGRQARLIELDPRYCDVIARRWSELTGHPALRNGEPVTLPGHDAPPAASRS